MKLIKTDKIEKNRLPAFTTVLLVSLMLLLTFAIPNTHAQQSSELSLADVIIALRSNKVTLAERNQILRDAVEERGITFTITAQIKKELESTGANKNLIEAITKKGTIVKVAATAEQPTNPITTPAPIELNFAHYKKTADENFAKGELDSAIMNYSKAIELNPANTSVYLNRGLIFYRKKDYEAAIADYSKAIELNPNEPAAYSNRANSYEKIDQLEKAAADYKKVIELDVDNSAAISALKKIEDDKAKLIEKQKEQQSAIAEVAEKERVAKETQDKERLAAEVAEADRKKNPEIIELGRISSSMAINMATPIYPDAAKRLNLKGQITVQVFIDEKGNVTAAETTDGNRLFRDSAEQAALKSKFKPAMFEDVAVKSKGYIVYNFVR